MQRLKLICLVALLGAFFAPSIGTAQTYPAKLVRLIVPYAPGGVLDGLARPLTQQLSELFRQPVIVENRPGGNTGVGTGVCAKGVPDGYTICASGSGLVFNPLMYRNLGYNPEKDLAPVTGMVLMHSVFTVNSSLPVHNLKELIAYTKANPGKLNFGSFGEGNPGHLLLEWIKNRAGLDFVHVPYKGAGPVIQAALSNEVQIIYMAIGAILPHIKAGKVRPVVVSGEHRSRILPDVPTFVDEGYDVRPQPWYGLLVPARTPRPIIDRIQADVRKVVLNPAFQEKVLFPQFYEPVGSTPEDFSQFLQRQRADAAELVRISGIKPVDM